ncbi:NosL domain-containing protein [Campylobacter blaseri]|uniref:nitrous oxide reductase accessory protein NosL n=1 Tax=Campylobacter blaseri TaxID=2042961 RepID=UPI001F4DA7A0|nr:nitrous oxide reductase accessory protein NosL [Campylobacter blaseri]QKF85672.1 NosL domain-containing protein [Campylobacter blaseri]
MRFVIFIFLALNIANSFALKPNENSNSKIDYIKSDFSSLSAKNLNDCGKALHKVKTRDGEILKYCSLGELAVHSMDMDILFSTISAVDWYTKKNIKADSAYYVVNSSLEYEAAFKNKEDALKFSKEFGGEIANLDKAYDVGFIRVENDLDKNIYKNEKKFYPMGERIYNLKCKKFNFENYPYINELKVDIFKNCKNLDERKAQLVLNYLWYKKSQTSSLNYKISPTDKDKCPVCGMFVYKYPKWTSSLKYADSKESKVLFFDGVKDMFKFIHSPKNYGANSNDLRYEFIHVTGYYTLEAIDAKDAFYVLGSDVLGPMGNELIPFKKEEDARVFRLDHVGMEILRFDEITKGIICKLDGRSCE